MNRKFLAARGDLVEKIKDFAKKRNLTLYSVVNDILEQSLKLEDTGKTFSQVVEEYSIVKAVKDAGFILTPKTLWYELLKKQDNSSIVNFWYEAGEWLGKYCKTVFPQNDIPKLLEKIVNIVFWDLSECTLKIDGEKALIRCISSNYSELQTNILRAFLSGMMRAFNYKTSKMEVATGIVAATFIREAGG
ncbi:MAG: hypothetical protein N3E48_02830 [Candidatus Bathyarchaeota archaeon]|nr:hypothetical protein [Candidatus Bathyarchaeota archaeon]